MSVGGSGCACVPAAVFPRPAARASGFHPRLGSAGERLRHTAR